MKAAPPRSRSLILALLFAVLPSLASGQTNEAVLAQAQREKQPLLATLEQLVSIESGSADFEGVTRIGAIIAERLRALGGAVELVPPASDMPRFTSVPERIADSVVARFRGRGTARILLLAHMDTVYERGMLAQQPFRIEGDRAYGLGIADDKHGVAVILHTLSMLKRLNVDRYGLLTVLMSPDEEVGSPAERDLITALGAEHDVVLSFEGPGQDESIRLATSGIKLAVLTVKGRASHAGNAPEQGRNALYELAHQLLQLRDLSDTSKAVKLNWTVAEAGSVFNAIPADATAIGDLRADDERDFEAIEAAIRERIKNHLIPDTTVEVRFERFFGLRNFGAHSNNAEYVDISSIEPRLYLVTRLIVDISDGKIASRN